MAEDGNVNMAEVNAIIASVASINSTDEWGGGMVEMKNV
jgi:hypothetical protein